MNKWQRLKESVREFRKPAPVLMYVNKEGAPFLKGWPSQDRQLEKLHLNDLVEVHDKKSRQDSGGDYYSVKVNGAPGMMNAADLQMMPVVVE